MTDHMCSLILSYIPPERHPLYLCEHWFSSEIAGRLFYLRPYTGITGSLLVTCTVYVVLIKLIEKNSNYLLSRSVCQNPENRIHYTELGNNCKNGRSSFDSWQGKKLSLLRNIQTNKGTNQLPIQPVSRVKQSWLEADDLPLSTTEGRNEWIYIRDESIRGM